MQNWSLHDAKNRFSALVEAARRGEPQLVTKRGAPAVVVVAAEESSDSRRCGRSGCHPLRTICSPFERIGVALSDHAL